MALSFWPARSFFGGKIMGNLKWRRFQDIKKALERVRISRVMWIAHKSIFAILKYRNVHRNIRLLPQKRKSLKSVPDPVLRFKAGRAHCMPLNVPNSLSFFFRPAAKHSSFSSKKFMKPKKQLTVRLVDFFGICFKDFLTTHFLRKCLKNGPDFSPRGIWIKSEIVSKTTLESHFKNHKYHYFYSPACASLLLQVITTKHNSINNNFSQAPSRYIQQNGFLLTENEKKTNKIPSSSQHDACVRGEWIPRNTVKRVLIWDLGWNLNRLRFWTFWRNISYP